MELLLSPRLNERLYYLSLFGVGLFWEKTVLLPFSVGLWRYFHSKEMSLRKQLNVFAASLLAACGGQLLLHILLGSQNIWLRTPWTKNVATLKILPIAFALVYGPALLAWTKLRAAPSLFKFLLWQWPVWLAIYLGLGGILSEMRAFLVMVPYSFPLLGMMYDQLTGEGPCSML
jgi:hypothetical protein